MQNSPQVNIPKIIYDVEEFRRNIVSIELFFELLSSYPAYTKNLLCYFFYDEYKNLMRENDDAVKILENIFNHIMKYKLNEAPMFGTDFKEVKWKKI